MRIVWDATTARVLATVSHQNVHSEGQITTDQLDLFAYPTQGLPDSLDALVLTSDLQARGRLFKPGTTRTPVPAAERDDRLLGFLVADTLGQLSATGVLPPAERMGIVLAGDLFAIENLAKRGGFGDVRDVWRAFRAVTRWVVGVAGNHDNFGTLGEELAFRRESGIHLLDCESVHLDGIHFAGVGGIIGPPRKPNRRREMDQLDRISRMLRRQPTMLILHQGPRTATQPGHPMVQRVCETSSPTWIVCGHDHWRNPFGDLANGTRILNTDSRTIILLREQCFEPLDSERFPKINFA
ncbi:metallophosphoesterase family protein [Tuwongella immobilis]|uniref:Calcineurin-like phosphoesterase domain-containing protein n=1 Tax=Tuwongella immobilis TaxID=692036 RepID=A0A6C2YHV6_9BACT|nr:metallophosphoesterase [Tuwongella immobilis]VIP00572.1 hypothetical protein : Uncharacterized protein OS=Myxococcus stipitatus (strain DSM 14675 / JCM 12634 / Mx s8) GN=MYSTI_01048 PE=4 SV=1 [Tuwongella immobilis]VTR96562.1 hypothetical protein : Uncharacterized protein OS=Myxococcus stipitatus (strain DSM 14675 / JCM 12634 / Mx s8) GN=MYSTI_01048 PE=4 SV=1 [Tuwongella immobilis]